MGIKVDHLSPFITIDRVSIAMTELASNVADLGLICLGMS